MANRKCRERCFRNASGGLVPFLAAIGLLATFTPRDLPAQASTIRSTKDGVYTEVQAVAGLAIYDSICGKCHNEANPLKGSRFLDKWTGKPLYAIWDFITTRMPYNAPGSLRPEQYAEVLAHVLKLNGYPSGSETLPHLPFAIANIDLDPPRLSRSNR